MLLHLLRSVVLVACLHAFATGQLVPYEETLIATMSNVSARNNLEMLTSVPHLAGTPGAEEVAKMYFDAMTSILSSIEEANISYDNHTALLSFPGDNDFLTVDSVSAILEEQAYAVDNTSDTEWNSKIWNGYGGAGVVTNRSAVYANYGRPEDFLTLENLNISVRGMVVITRYGGCFRGIKTREAQIRGAAAVLIFSDPQEYGGPNYGTDANETYPKGPYLPWSGAQRGSVLNLPVCPGDPNRATVIEKCGVGVDDLLPSIPVMPISAENGRLIMQGLGGGAVREAWRGGLPNVAYTYGPGHRVSLRVSNERRTEKVINVIVTIPGSLPANSDNPVLLGNHRDAWVFGAADPNSGSVAMLEVARGFNEAWLRGWRPLRTIIMGSWDAEELGIIGSTAYAESNERSLINASVYINVDTAVSGPNFGASASPSLIDLILTTAMDLNNNRDRNGDSPLIEIEADNIGALGGGSDYAPFLNHLGIASIDVGFGFGGSGYPVYHSVYDSFHWMQTFGDPQFIYHVTAAQMWGVMAMRMATNAVLPMNVVGLSGRLGTYFDEAETAFLASEIQADIGLAQLRSDIADYDKTTQAFSAVTKTFSQEVTEGYNYILAANEKSFVWLPGLPNRKWYKNVLMASGMDKGYGVDTFPGLMQAIADNDPKLAQEQIEIIQNCIANSVQLLKTVPGGLPLAVGTDDDEVATIVGLAVGLPLLLFGTVALVHQLSSETSALLTLINPSRRGYGPPVSTTTEDGTSTDV